MNAFVFIFLFSISKSTEPPKDFSRVTIRESQEASVNVAKSLSPSGILSWKVDLSKTWNTWFQALPQEKQEIVKKSWLSTSKGGPVPFEVYLWREQGLVRLEFYVKLKYDFATYARISDDPPHFNEWMFENINKKPTGGQYFIRLFPFSKMLRGQGPDHCPTELALPMHEKTFHTELPYFFEFLTVKRESSTRLELSCGPQGAQWREWHAENLEGHLLHHGFSRFILFSADGRETYAVGISDLKVKAWLYDLLPLPLMISEAKERMEIVFRNYENRAQLLTQNSGARKN